MKIAAFLAKSVPVPLKHFLTEKSNYLVKAVPFQDGLRIGQGHDRTESGKVFECIDYRYRRESRLESLESLSLSLDLVNAVSPCLRTLFQNSY